MSLTASFVRAKHEVDVTVPVCDYFEVVVKIWRPYCYCALQNFSSAQLKMTQALLPQGIYSLVSLPW